MTVSAVTPGLVDCFHGDSYAADGISRAPAPGIRLTDGGGFMGAGPMDMSRYMEMFMRLSEINRVVEEIPGGVRTTTESKSPDLTAQLQAHVSSMYSHLDQGAEVMCMSASLPTLFRHANGYRRQLTFTPTGVIAEETADDSALTQAIRAHAREVTGFVRDGMPAIDARDDGLRNDGPRRDDGTRLIFVCR